MALVMGYRYSLTQEQILAFSRNMGVAENREGIRRIFVDYIVREDQSKLTLPTSDVYDSLHLSGAILLVPPIEVQAKASAEIVTGSASKKWVRASREEGPHLPQGTSRRAAG
jgi:hypothetical protein